MKFKLVVGLAIVLGCIVAVLAATGHLAMRNNEKLGQETDAGRAANQVNHAPAPVAAAATPEESSPEEVADADTSESEPVNAKDQSNPDTNVADAPVSAEEARAALSLVGTDPAAEKIWLRAINDPNLPAHTRSDLIEDLNEDGFPDPKHITQDDLPLIENRIALVERHSADAMDNVNLDAFMEAYKDLVNMRARLTGQ